eukprot:COSAG04_NODE_31303_length_257_cov_0.968354_1_plen_26_part_10
MAGQEEERQWVRSAKGLAAEASRPRC